MLFYEHSETRYGLESDMFLQGLYLGVGKPNPTQCNPTQFKFWLVEWIIMG